MIKLIICSKHVSLFIHIVLSIRCTESLSLHQMTTLNLRAPSSPSSFILSSSSSSSSSSSRIRSAATIRRKRATNTKRSLRSSSLGAVIAKSSDQSIGTISGSKRTQNHKRRRRERERQIMEGKYIYPLGVEYHNDDADDNDDELLSSLSYEVDSFQELQRSMGSEILDDKLQKQIDSTNDATPNVFLDTHSMDASQLEKVAMSTVPEQLPLPAVNAFRHRQQQQQKKKRLQLQQRKRELSNIDTEEEEKNQRMINKNNDRRRTQGLEFAPSKSRVNAEEEIELAKMIQRGVWLHKLKTDKEGELGRSINKNEWAELANFDNATHLRREVATYRRAKQLLVSANMGLVHAVVKKKYYHVRHQSGLTYEELIQEGSLGLIRAAELFDPSRGVRFSTYATIWIKGSLSHSHILDGSITLPNREKTIWNKIMKAHNDITNEKGGLDDAGMSFKTATSSGVSVEEIAIRLDMKVEDVLKTERKMNSMKNVLSLDYEYQTQTRGGSNVGNGSGQQLIMDMDKNLQSDVNLAERTQLKADIIAAMVRNLTPREARLIRLRYGLTTDGRTHTIQECADAMGVSASRASTLAGRCLKKLKNAAEADSLEEYFLTIA